MSLMSQRFTVYVTFRRLGIDSRKEGMININLLRHMTKYGKYTHSARPSHI